MIASTRTTRRRAAGASAALAVLLLGSACGSRLTDNELLAVERAGAQENASPASDSATPQDSSGDTGSVDDGATALPEIAAGGTTPATSGGATVPASGGSTAASPSVPRSGAAAAPSSGGPTSAAGQPAAAPAAGPTAQAGQAAAPGKASPAAPAAPAPGQPAPAPGATSDGSPVKLGVMGTFTGVLGAAMMPGLEAARAWGGYINAKGGLAGHPVQLVVADDRGDPNQAVALIRRLVEEDKVLAVYGAMMPATLQSILPYVNEKQMPIIGTCSCMNAAATSPMVFTAGASDKTGVTWGHIAGIFSGTDKRKAALFYCREAVTCSEYRTGIKTYDGHDGLDFVYETQISLAQPDFTSEVLAARNAGAEIIVSVSENPTIIRIAKSAKRQNYPVIISTQHGGDDGRFISDGGADVEGVLFTSPTAHWVTSAKMADYRESMKRYVPNGNLGSLGSGMWTAGKMFERISQSFPPKPTTADVLAGLYTVKGETLGGIIAPTTYVQGAPSQDLANACVLPMQVRDQKPVPTNGGPESFSCAPGWKLPGT
jgi:branched-chain amino acid transport system substrate-binding protein